MVVNHKQHWLEGLFFKKWDSDLRFRNQIKGLQYVRVYSCETLTHANRFLVFKPNCRTNSWSNHYGDFAMEYVRESHQSTVFSTQISKNYQGFNDTVSKTERQWNILTWKGWTGLNLDLAIKARINMRKPCNECFDQMHTVNLPTLNWNLNGWKWAYSDSWHLTNVWKPWFNFQWMYVQVDNHVEFIKTTRDLHIKHGIYLPVAHVSAGIICNLVSVHVAT
jgi:hypothetical protein